MKYSCTALIFLFVFNSFCQKGKIEFETNGKHEVNSSENPFRNFIGEWTLKDDKWTQNWGDTTETITIPQHHTISSPVNTKNSLLSIIDGPEPNGHIFWSYNPVTKEVRHLSNFGELRAGVGEGSVSEKGDVKLKISFEGEPKDTYRIYNYKWLTKDSYHMTSIQYSLDNFPTGLFYEGTFVRLIKYESMLLRMQIEKILAVLDNNALTVEEQLEVYDDAVVHMAPGSQVNFGKEALRVYLNEQRQYGSAEMQHKIVEMEAYEDLVLMQGEVTGTFYPKDGTRPVEFKTKNLFVFDSKEGVLKIKKIIYNTSPPNNE